MLSAIILNPNLSSEEVLASTKVVLDARKDALQTLFNETDKISDPIQRMDYFGKGMSLMADLGLFY